MVRQGFKVKGSTTTPEKLTLLEDHGIEPFLASFPETEPKTHLPDFLTTDVLVFNIPPSKSSRTDYLNVLESVLQALPATVQQVVFVSSTSVYPNSDSEKGLTEADAVASPAAETLMLQCEALVQTYFPENYTILRFGGLMGGTRHPGKFLAGKTGVGQPQGPVNMIHLADCVQILTQVILQGKTRLTLNACAPHHPTREEFYIAAAKKLNLSPPSFDHTSPVQSKVIHSDLLVKELGYQFIYPDPVGCLDAPDF